MCEMVDPSNSRSSQVECTTAIKTRYDRKTAIYFMRARYKGPIWVGYWMGKEGLLKAATKFMLR